MGSSGGAPRGRSRRAVQSSTLHSGRGSGREGNILDDRRMEHIATVSRSGGLGKDGDLLKERIVQEEFRAFINKKLKTFWDLYGPGSPIPMNESMRKQKSDNQENILILLRKLREGLFASDRKDSFALEVYETSLYLSVVFGSPVQTTSILSRLVPYLYSASSAPQPFRMTTILTLLLHQLVTAFPSQQTYVEQVKFIVPNFLERSSPTYLWISALARTLRTSNFVQFEKLSHPDAFQHLLPSSSLISSSNVKTAIALPNLPQDAVHDLVSRLRLRARDVAWTVVRNAYRELSSSSETQIWLGKRLFFDSFGSEAAVVSFDEWVQARRRDGQLRPKEGFEGRWMVCKTK